MMKEIRIGLVGSGWMGKAHSSALADAQMLFGPEYGVAKFVVLTAEAAAKAAQEKIGFERVTTDWHDVVTAPDVDLETSQRRTLSTLRYQGSVGKR